MRLLDIFKLGLMNMISDLKSYFLVIYLLNLNLRLRFTKTLINKIKYKLIKTHEFIDLKIVFYSLYFLILKIK